MRFRFIEDRRADYPVTLLCDVLGVSPAGYYAWRSRPESRRSAANRDLVDDIRRVHRDTRGRYGSPRIHVELKAQGRGASRGRIERLMRRHGIRAIMARPRRVRTTDSRHDLPIAPNLLDRNFIATAPNQIWLADITYIETDQGWLYLAAVMDLYSRRIVGWAMAEHLRADLPLAALRMAISAQRPSAGLIHHSDRGAQGGFNRSSQHQTLEVAMGIRKRRSLRSGRAPLPSPGRPSVAGRSELQRFWLGIAQGMTSEDAALTAGMSQPVGTRLFRKAGGMPPATFRSSAKPPSGRYLSFAEREEIALFAFKASRGVRSGAVLVDLPPPSRVSYDATPRRAAAAWSIVHRQPNGTPSDRPVGPNPPSLHSTQPCALMWSRDWPESP